MGEVFAGRYELVDLLGEGGMGAVWRAFDHRAGCYVAAKVLRHSDAASLLRFVREQSYRISHPHVVAPRGWAGEDSRVLFTMDLVRGGSLATLVGDYGPLPSQWVALLIDQVLSGLSAVHAAGLVHRDVKPGNVLLEPTGRSLPVAKLTDFGVAVAVSEPRLTRTSQLVGTPGYLAPEVARGADPWPRQDLYAVGVLMAELLCGARPLPANGLAMAPPSGVPERLWVYARRLAAPAPTDRPETAEQARTELAALGVLPPPGVVPDDEGADLEVLDVVPELPPGWGPTGRTIAGHEPPVAEPPRTVGAAEAGVADAGRRAPLLVPEPVPASAPAAPAGRPGRRTWLLAAASALLIAGGLSFGTWVLTNDALWSRPGEGSSPRPTGSSRPSQPPTAAASCDFTEAGQRDTTAGGVVVVCRQQPDGSYRWVP